MSKNNDFEIYIHIPFCQKKCAYCDFVSFPADEGAQEAYLQALSNEIRARTSELQGKASSVFLGGGTPGILKAERINGLMKLLKNEFDIRPDAEITIETNPCTLTEEKAHTYIESGINRISLGAQSIFDHHLKKLQRCHDFKIFMKSYEIIKSAGFNNINIDLMFALPGQTLYEWEQTLDYAGRLDVSHISAYSLKIEEGTLFYDIRDSLELPDDETAAKMYDVTAEILGRYGFERYEISNYAKNGAECRHNLGYWTLTPYLGLGLAAASFTGTHRFANTSDPVKYMRNCSNPDLLKENICCVKNELENEFMILGLRLAKGVSAKEFYDRFGSDIYHFFGNRLSRLIKSSFLIQEGDYIRIPEKYFFVSNSIMSEFI